MFGKYRDRPDGKCCDVCNTRHCQWDACMPATRRKVQFNICVQWSFHKKKRISCALAYSRFLVSPQSCPNHLGHPLLQFTLRPGRMNQAKVFLPCWKSWYHGKVLTCIRQMVSIHLRRGSKQVCPKVLVIFVNFFQIYIFRMWGESGLNFLFKIVVNI